MAQGNGIERGFERVLFASRWLMAPMYLGLVVVLAMLLVVFARELLYSSGQVLTLTTEDVILSALTLIDLTLAANLIVIVVFSGYESFLSRMDVGEERPAWMGTVDFSGLKMKLIASIVAISAISLLKRFMEIGTRGPLDEGQRAELLWITLIHLVFVVSGVLMATMDWLGARGGKRGPGAAAAAPGEKG